MKTYSRNKTRWKSPDFHLVYLFRCNMFYTEDNEADYGGEEGEVFHASKGVGIVKGNVQNPGNIACQKRHGDEYVEKGGK